MTLAPERTPRDLPPAPGVDRAQVRWQSSWEHRPLLLALARARVGWHDAEDVVSEALLRAAHAVDIPEAALRSWLVTTTLRLCADVGRRDARDAHRSQRLTAFEVHEQVGPEEQVTDQSEARWYAEQLPRLPQRQARVLTLRSQGKDIATIALRLALPYKTVESLLTRARRGARGWAAVLASIGLIRWTMKRSAQLHAAAVGVVAAGDAANSAISPVAKTAGVLVRSRF